MIRSITRLLAAVLMTAAVVPGPATAAPTLTTDRACYTYRQPVYLSGGGYQPGSAQTVSLDGKPLPTGKDSGNTFIPTAQGKVPSNSGFPAQRPFAGKTSVRTYTLTASSSPSGSPVTARTSFQVVHTNVNVDPPFITGGSVRYTALGFTYGPKLYVHYLKGRRQSHVATRLVGRLHGACGRLNKRRRMFLFRPVRPAKYTLLFDNSQHYPASYGSFFSFQALVTSTFS